MRYYSNNHFLFANTMHKQKGLIFAITIKALF